MIEPEVVAQDNRNHGKAKEILTSEADALKMLGYCLSIKTTAKKIPLIDENSSSNIAWGNF